MHLNAGRHYFMTVLNKSLRTSLEANNFWLIQAFNWSKNNFSEIHISQGLDWLFPFLSHYGSCYAEICLAHNLIFFAEYYGSPGAKLIFCKRAFLPFPMSYSFMQGFRKNRRLWVWRTCTMGFISLSFLEGSGGMLHLKSLKIKSWKMHFLAFWALKLWH